MGLFSFSGIKPTNLGVVNGALRACNVNAQNCVHSGKPGTLQYIEPFKVLGNATSSKQKLLTILAKMQNVTVKAATEDYIHAECSSNFFGFVDDLEFYIDRKANLIQIRSQARLGVKDFNVNRDRVEAIRRAYQG